MQYLVNFDQMKLYFETVDRLKPKLRAGNLAACESAVIDALLALPESPFHMVANLSITNKPSDIAKHFDQFIYSESEVLDIKAIYTEMNGFTINPDR